MANVTLEGYGTLPLLPYQPVAPLTEIYEWKTDVITSWEGKEERRQLRRNPRYTYNMTLKPPPNMNSDVLQTLHAGRSAQHWACPLWTRAENVGTLDPGQDVITFDLSYSGLGEGDTVFFWSPCDGWTTRKIDSVDGSDFYLDTGIQGQLRHAWFMPIHAARLMRNIDRTTNGWSNTITLTLESREGAIVQEAGLPQYAGYDILVDPTLLRSGTIEESLVQDVQTIDYEVGKTAEFYHWTYSRSNKPYNVLAEGRTEVEDWLTFLGSRRGTKEPYWHPTFEEDYRLDPSVSVITDEIDVRRDSFIDLESNRQRIWILMKDGSWYARGIESYTVVSSSRARITLDTELPSVDVKDISYISHLGFYRLAADRIELLWIGNNVVRSSVSTTELPAP